MNYIGLRSMKTHTKLSFKSKKSNIILAVALVLILALSSGLNQSLASKPVKRKQTGCVIEKSFVNADGYVLRLYYRRDEEKEQEEVAERRPDLSPFEGRMLVLEGRLHPGDRYTLDREPRDVGPCPPAKLKQMVKELMDRCCGKPISEEKE